MSPFLVLGIAFCIDSAVSGLYFLISTHASIAKATYKNSLMAFALGKLGLDIELKRLKEGLVKLLYNDKTCLFRQSTKDKTEASDNSALALVALNYEELEHSVF